MLRQKLFFGLTLFLINISLFAQQQTLVVEWESEPGQRIGNTVLNLTAIHEGFHNIRDFNSDGVDDLFGVYDASSPYIALAINGANHEETWQFELPAGFDPDQHKFIGFYLPLPDIDGESKKQAVFAKRTGKRLSEVIVVSVTGFNHSFGDAVLLDIDDFDHDGFDEFLMGDRTNRVVQMWGAGN